MRNPVTKKVLVPIATIAGAATIAVGSGATFTSQTEHSISSMTSGTLKHSNSKANAAIFDLKNMKPGDTLKGGLTITNTGSLPAAFSLTEAASTNGFTGDYLTLEITNTTTNTQVSSGTFGHLADGEKHDLGVIDPDVTHTFAFTVKLDPAAPNTEQGKSAAASYQWDSVQLASEAVTQ